MAIGVTTGQNNGGLFNGSYSGLYASTYVYGASQGTTTNGGYLAPSNAVFCVTSDSSKSGIVCVIGDRSIISKKLGKFIIKY